MKAGFIAALLAIAMLCASAMAQENTADYWYKTGINLTGNGSYEKAVEAYENAIKLSPRTLLSGMQSLKPEHGCSLLQEPQ
jgi:outer membrane protein assembly factor BamD (BamD/ComL family)